LLYRYSYEASLSAVSDRVKPSFVTFDIASECPDVKNYKLQLNPVWHRILYSCAHIATVGVKGLNYVHLVIGLVGSRYFCYFLVFNEYYYACWSRIKQDSIFRKHIECHGQRVICNLPCVQFSSADVRLYAVFTRKNVIVIRPIISRLGIACYYTTGPT